MTRRRLTLWLALASLAAGACARPGEERAERDLTVGHAENATLEVHVGGGLAAVRELTDTRVALWCGAPGFELELITHAPVTLTLALANAMPAVELVTMSPGAAISSPETASPTKKSWHLTLPAGSSRFRVATPDAAVSGPFRFALMSDVQEAIDRVGDIYARVNATPGVSFLLGAGDLTQRGTVAELERFQRELGALDVPYYTTLGNHELGTTPAPFQDYAGRASFQFVHRGVYFTLLDSGSATLDPLVREWLDGWLASARRSVHVVAMHIPPLDPIGVRNGAFGSRAEASALLADLAEGGVDLTLYGHIHSHYAFDNAGIPAFISGGGGAIPERFDQIGRHFMLFDVDPENGIESSEIVRVD